MRKKTRHGETTCLHAISRADWLPPESNPNKSVSQLVVTRTEGGSGPLCIVGRELQLVWYATERDRFRERHGKLVCVLDGCLQVDTAAKKATADKRCFLVDYQMPTDPHNLECAKRFHEGAIANLGVVKSFYYGGIFGDPPLTKSIASRLRSLIWVNDMTLGGSYHVNACIHPIQAMMWVLGQTPVAAAGISRIARAEPHGDSHDMYGITYEFADGLIWTHTGRHASGPTGPDDPLATCEFLGSAYMKIGYGGRAVIRGGPKHYAGGTIDDLYAAGAVRNIASFHQQITAGDFAPSC